MNEKIKNGISLFFPTVNVLTDFTSFCSSYQSMIFHPCKVTIINRRLKINLIILKTC